MERDEYENLQDELDDMDDGITMVESDANSEDDEETSGEETEEESEEDSESEGGEGEGDSEDSEEEEDAGEEEEEESTEDSTEDNDSTPAVDDLATLRAEIDRLNGLLLNPPVVPVKEPEKDSQEEKTEVKLKIKPAGPGQTFDFVKDLDMDDVSANPEVFNQVINQAVQQAVQQVMTTVPTVIGGQIQQQTTINNSIRQFYQENPDLMSVKQTVGAVADNLAKEHSDWKMDKILTEAAVGTRKLLRLPDPTTTSDDSDSHVETDPNKAGATKKKKKARSRGKIKISAEQREIDEL